MTHPGQVLFSRLRATSKIPYPPTSRSRKAIRPACLRPGCALPSERVLCRGIGVFYPELPQGFAGRFGIKVPVEIPDTTLRLAWRSSRLGRIRMNARLRICVMVRSDAVNAIPKTVLTVHHYI
jgi:hypothetical protein